MSAIVNSQLAYLWLYMHFPCIINRITRSIDAHYFTNFPPIRASVAECDTSGRIALPPRQSPRNMRARLDKHYSPLAPPVFLRPEWKPPPTSLRRREIDTQLGLFKIAPSDATRAARTALLRPLRLLSELRVANSPRLPLRADYAKRLHLYV